MMIDVAVLLEANQIRTLQKKPSRYLINPVSNIPLQWHWRTGHLQGSLK